MEQLEKIVREGWESLVERLTATTEMLARITPTLLACWALLLCAAAPMVVLFGGVGALVALVKVWALSLPTVLSVVALWGLGVSILSKGDQK